MQLHKIKNHRGNWIQGGEKISRTAIRHFKKLFNLEPITINSSVLQCIPRCISNEENFLLTIIPEEEEIKEAIFSMNPSSSTGPDGYDGTFYQRCWDIIKEDVVAYVQYFFNGGNLTKFFNHTCLALIQKIESPNTFSDLRPISLCNFFRTVIGERMRRSCLVELDCCPFYSLYTLPELPLIGKAQH